MRLEELNDKSLFKILKVIYNDIDELDDLYGDDFYGDNDTVSKIK
jgi:hypothetical protein